MGVAESSALIERAQAGEQLAYPQGTPSGELAEAMLSVPTGVLLEARERNPALAALDLEAALARLGHEWISVGGVRFHLELHTLGAEAPSVVIAHGLGDHTRRHTPLASALFDRGFNVIGVDRQGHGLSEGRRGDAPLQSDLAVVEAAIALARARSRGPVVLLGDSLGGIMTWYGLTRELDIDAALCHCIGHPDVHPDPSFRFKAPLTKALARLAPYAPVSVRQIADYEHVALDPLTKDYFDREVDRLFNFSVTARSVASYLGFKPGISFEEVETPVLVMIGAADRLVTPEFTREAFDRATPPRAELLEIPGAGHQLFLDDLGAALAPLSEWLERTLAALR